MSSIVRGGRYTDAEWLARIALPRVRSAILAAARKRVTGISHGKIHPQVAKQIERSLGLPSMEPL